jgi:hypothetical protein
MLATVANFFLTRSINSPQGCLKIIYLKPQQVDAKCLIVYKAEK